MKANAKKVERIQKKLSAFAHLAPTRLSMGRRLAAHQEIQFGYRGRFKFHDKECGRVQLGISLAFSWLISQLEALRWYVRHVYSLASLPPARCLMPQAFDPSVWRGREAAFVSNKNV